MIACTRLAKAYGGKQILSDLSLAVRPGEWITVLGRSGSGKTTLARLLLGEERPDGGSVDVDGVDVATLPPAMLQLLRGRIGPMFQEPLLIDGDSVTDNVLLPLDIQRIDRAKSERVAGALLMRLGLAEKEHASVKQLSKGERMLVCVARAMAGNPLIVLADEPTTYMDDVQADAAIGLLADGHAAGMTVVFFTSDSDLAKRLPGRVVRLQGGRIADDAAEKAIPGKPTSHRILDENRPILRSVPMTAPAASPASVTLTEEADAAEPVPTEAAVGEPQPESPHEELPAEGETEKPATEEKPPHAAHHRKKSIPPPRKKGPRKKEDGGRKIKITPIGS